MSRWNCHLGTVSGELDRIQEVAWSGHLASGCWKLRRVANPVGSLQWKYFIQLNRFQERQRILELIIRLGSQNPDLCFNGAWSQSGKASVSLPTLHTMFAACHLRHGRCQTSAFPAIAARSGRDSANASNASPNCSIYIPQQSRRRNPDHRNSSTDCSSTHLKRLIAIDFNRLVAHP